MIYQADKLGMKWWCATVLCWMGNEALQFVIIFVNLESTLLLKIGPSQTSLASEIVKLYYIPLGKVYNTTLR